MNSGIYCAETLGKVQKQGGQPLNISGLTISASKSSVSYRSLHKAKAESNLIILIEGVLEEIGSITPTTSGPKRLLSPR